MILPIKLSTGTYNNYRKSVPNYNHNNYKTLQNDVVSFSSSRLTTQVDENEKEAIDIAKKLMKLQRSGKFNFEEISNTLNKKSPVPIEIKGIEELPEQYRLASYSAYMQPVIADDMKLKAAKIYLKNPSDKKEAGEVMASTAHEFTHVLQRHKNNDYLGLGTYCDNIYQARFLNALGTSSFEGGFGTMGNILGNDSAFQNQLRKNFARSIVPDEADILRTIKKHVEPKDLFDSVIDKNIEDLMKYPDASVIKNNELLNNKDNLKQIIRANIKRHAQMEREATDVTLETLKLWGACDKYNVFNRKLIRQIYSLIEKII